MIKTKNIYLDYQRFKIEPEPQFRDRYPTWSFVDRIGDLWITRVMLLTVIRRFLCDICHTLVVVFVVACSLFDGTYSWRYCQLVRA